MIRIRIIKFSIICVFLLLCLRLLSLQVINGIKFRQLSNRNSLRFIPQFGSRGKITDRNGKVIVESKLSYDVMVMPQGKDSAEAILVNISRISGIDFSELENNYQNNFLSYSMPVKVAENIEKSKIIALEEMSSGLGELVIQPHPLRHYPYGKLACHLIGYLHEIDLWRLRRLADYGYKTKDIVGFGGVEEKYDYYLRQEEGALSIEVDHRGRFIRMLGFRPPRNGEDIQLTLDLSAQQIAEEALGQRRGAVIIMDASSGEVIAMASGPGFDPAIFVKKSGGAIRNIFRDSNSPLLNRAISGVYPAGSVFKLVVAAAALETGRINLSSSFFCPGSLSIGSRQIACWDTHASQSLIPAIARSCNVFFCRIGLLLGPQSIRDYALQFALAKHAIADIPYGQSGLIPDPAWKKLHKLQGWYDGDTANISIGQGDVLVTPMQIARMTAVFANGGILVTPHVIKAIGGRGISSYRRKAARAKIKESTLAAVKNGMRDAINDEKGTAHVLDSLKVAVAGKTGTAQAPHGESHAWFAGFFPFKNPKFVICVFLERGGHGHASVVLTRQIIEGMLKEGLLDEKDKS